MGWRLTGGKTDEEDKKRLLVQVRRCAGSRPKKRKRRMHRACEDNDIVR